MAPRVYLLVFISTRPIDTRPDLYEITQEVLCEILQIEARRKNFKQNLWQTLYQLKNGRDFEVFKTFIPKSRF